MLTSATKVGPEGSLEAHYKLVGNTLGCGRVASVRCALPRLLRCPPPLSPPTTTCMPTHPRLLSLFPLASHTAASPHHPCALRSFLCLHKTPLLSPPFSPPFSPPPPPFSPFPPRFARRPTRNTTMATRDCACGEGREAVERATGAVVAVKACSKKVLAARPAYISRVSAAPSFPTHHRNHLLSHRLLGFDHLLLLPSCMPLLPPPSSAALLPRSLPSPQMPLTVHFHAPFTGLSSPPSCFPSLSHRIPPHLAPPVQLWSAPAPVSPPIIRLLATHEDNRHLHIVTDKAQGGDLFMALAARSSFTEADAAHIGVWGNTHRYDSYFRSEDMRSSFIYPPFSFPRPPFPLTSPFPPTAPYSPAFNRSVRARCPLRLPSPPSLLTCAPISAAAAAGGGAKPENILLSDTHSLTIKLVDFGSAALFHPAPTPATTTTTSSGTTTGEAVRGEEGTEQRGKGGGVLRDFMGTAFYAAPEVWQHAYGPQADVWSAGAVVAVLLTGPPPSGLTRATVHSNATWQAMQVRGVHGRPAGGRVQCRRRGAADGAAAQWTHSRHHMQVALQCHVAGHAGVRRAAAQSFLRALLEPDPWQRPTAAHALLHPWLAGTAEGVAAAVAGDTTQPAVAATGASLARASPLVAAPLTAQPGVGAEEASAGERVSGAAAEMQKEGTGKAGEEDGERSARDEERGERKGEMAARRVGQKEEEMLWKGRAQGGAAAEGRVRGGVQLEGSLRGFRLYAATRKLQRACVALLSLELSESEFRQLVRHLASATSAPGTSLEAVSESGGTVEGQSDDRGEQQQQQQHPPSAMLSLPALLASLDALGHERLSQQLMGVHSSVMAHSMLAHVLPTVTLQAGAVHSGASAAGSSAAGGESEREGCVRGGSGIAAALEKQRQEQQQQGAATSSLAHQPPALPPASSSLAIPPVPLHRGSRRFLGLMKGGEGEKGGEGGGSVHGGSLHGSRRFVSAIRVREGEQHKGGGSQHGSRRFFGLFGGREQEDASSRAGGSQHGSRRFFTMMPGSGAPSPAAAGAPSPGGSLRGSFRMARRLGLLRMGGEEGEGEEEDMASPGADGDVVGAMGGMGARSAAPLALRGPLSPRSPSASTHSDNAGGWARRLNARASAGGAGMTWQSPVGPGKSPLAQGVSPQSGGRQHGRGAVGSGASSGAATLPAAASAGAGHADRGGLPGGVGMLSCQRVQSCVDLAAMGGAAGDESSPAARNGGSRGWGRGRGKGGFWGPVKGGVQGGGGMGGMNGKGTSVHGECLYREFLLSECTP
ncbi:unnamed protein product [Closterium sp. Naga37s-1]|nr:unnamed protein product [Closterium sp. Naga37s-1]